MADWKTTKTRHGTHSGWRLHQALGQRPCTPCYNAKAEYDRRRLSAPEYVRKNRLSAKAQSKAYQVLKRLYPEEYRILFEGFRDQLIREEEEEYKDEEEL